MAISRLLVFALSLTAGGGAAWLTTTGGPEVAPPVVAAPAGPETAPPALAEVLVAATDLEQRRKLAEGDLHWQPWPEDNVHDSYITRSEQPDAVDAMTGHVVRAAILAGEPVRQERISDTGGGFMSTQLSPGKRAVAVKVNAGTTAGGFILPDDRVDVLHTTVPEGASGGVTRTVVTNIRVLAIGQQVDAPEAANSIAVGETATLELDPVQAEVVSAAQASGSLSLALRSTADDSEVQVVTPTREAERTVHIISGGESHVARTRTSH